MADYVIKRVSYQTPVYRDRTETLTLGTSDREYTTNTSSSQSSHTFTFRNIELNQRTQYSSATSSNAFGVVDLQDNVINIRGTVTTGSNPISERLYFRFTGTGELISLYNVTKNQALQTGSGLTGQITTQGGTGDLGAFATYVEILSTWNVDDGDIIRASIDCDVAYEYWTISESLTYTVSEDSDDPVCSPTTIPFSFSRYNITGNCTASIRGTTLTCRINATYYPTNEDEDTAGGMGNKTIHTFSSEQVTVSYTIPGGTTYSYTFSGSDNLTYTPVGTPTYTLTGPSGASLVGSVSRNGKTVVWKCQGTSSTLPSSSTLRVTYRYVSYNYSYRFPIYFNGTLKSYERIYFNGVVYNASNYPS